MWNIKIFERKKLFLKKYAGLFLSLAIVLVSVFIGIFIGQKWELRKIKQYQIEKLVNKDADPGFGLVKEIDFSIFWDTWNKIKQDYVHQPVSDSALFYGALQGLVAGLEDPYSVFFKPQIAEEFQMELSGKFEGIGAEIGIRDNVLTIISPLLDSPAEKAGLRAGDKVVAIDDYDTTGIALDYAVKLIRGEKGTEVRLLIIRDGLEKAKEIKVIRDKIVIKSVQWNMLDDKIAHIRLLQFGTDTVKDFDKVLKEVILKNPKGIILDLRNNPGGFLEAAINIAGEWIPNDVVVREKYKEQDEGLRSAGKGRLKDFKTVVLINKGSASASEIVAGALKDYNLATIVGEKSFGKGSVQDYNDFSDGSALKLTIALWYTPNGNSIDKQGIEPDIEVIRTDEDYLNNKDPQLDKALEILNN